MMDGLPEEGSMKNFELDQRELLNEITLMRNISKPDSQGNQDMEFNSNGKKIKIKMHKIDDNDVSGEFLSD